MISEVSSETPSNPHKLEGRTYWVLNFLFLNICFYHFQNYQAPFKIKFRNVLLEVSKTLHKEKTEQFGSWCWVKFWNLQIGTTILINLFSALFKLQSKFETRCRRSFAQCHQKWYKIKKVTVTVTVTVTLCFETPFNISKRLSHDIPQVWHLSQIVKLLLILRFPAVGTNFPT